MCGGSPPGAPRSIEDLLERPAGAAKDRPQVRGYTRRADDSWSTAALDLSTRGRQIASLFGDGAGAVVVSATDEDRGVRGCCLGADGRHADKLADATVSTEPLTRRGVVATADRALSD